MYGLWQTLVAWAVLAVTYAQSPRELIGAVGTGIQKEIAAVKQPVDESIAYVGSTQCENVKKLFGVTYEQLAGEQEPDLNALTIVFKTRYETTVMNITEAPARLRQARSSHADDKFILYVHGFTDDPTKDSFANISQSFLEKGYASVVAVDGSSLIKWLYIRATTYIQFMGRKLGEVLASVVYDGIDPANIHLIGHSLGAHISGFAGKTFRKLTGKLIGRLTALDPAGPCFTHVEPGMRLKKDDARFVDVVHTDAGVYGIKEPLGHMDFYPNSGQKQPNCLFQTCSHSRAWLLFGESVLRPDAFQAVLCKDWEQFRQRKCDKEIVYMGYAAKPGRPGNYYLQTGEEYPYGRGANGTRFVNNEAIITNIGNGIGNLLG
ncbi:pancreatic triacylglycerol lipase-like [Aricia agestis]|uniref:pancreatic triacylglycerol lipase-like n=1 Tax=Aricia agestis TaxID=91739 RepID=UPI001C208CE6|nr:pancreatic triacylglycerol lipase-like [Aricia agestis]